jgi:hypothetical protein
VNVATPSRCQHDPRIAFTARRTMKPARSVPFDKILQIRAPETLTDALDAAARKRMVNRSDYIRVALLDRLKADGIDPASMAGSA